MPVDPRQFPPPSRLVPRSPERFGDPVATLAMLACIAALICGSMLGATFVVERYVPGDRLSADCTHGDALACFLTSA